MAKSAISTADETSAQLGPSVRNNSAIVLCVGKHADRNDWRMSNTLEPFESEQSLRLFVGFGMASKEEFVPVHVRLSSSLQVLVAGYVLKVARTKAQWAGYYSKDVSVLPVPLALDDTEASGAFRDKNKCKRTSSPPPLRLFDRDAIKAKHGASVVRHHEENRHLCFFGKQRYNHDLLVLYCTHHGYSRLLRYRVHISPAQASFGRDSMGNPVVSVEVDISGSRIDLRGFTREKVKFAKLIVHRSKCIFRWYRCTCGIIQQYQNGLPSRRLRNTGGW
ncbi:hypothetical protein EV421DRAFT_1739610 [Armillaria borealis]|uniref:Uncharacterized protein n=1 Tax=Armillaria borealis TaxID=47425 RepID=A0AA39J7T8_9AGAR|nr:hypothetical protein EV421DRAFT_1739610 [Armillaria borealis]